MVEGLMRVREFAAACGCTPQNIYGHLKTYAAELEGHTYQGKGRQGVMLDAFAQDFLRSIMYPKEISDNVLMEEMGELRRQLFELGMQHTQLATKLATTEAERDKAMLEAGQAQKALMAAQEAEEARVRELTEVRGKAEQLTGDLQVAQEALAAEKARNQRLMSRGLWARLTNKEVE